MAAGLQECVHAAVRGELGGRDKESAHRVPQTHRDPRGEVDSADPGGDFFFFFFRGKCPALATSIRDSRARKRKKTDFEKCTTDKTGVKVALRASDSSMTAELRKKAEKWSKSRPSFGRFQFTTTIAVV